MRFERETDRDHKRLSPGPFGGFLNYLYDVDRFSRLYVEGLGTISRSHSSNNRGLFTEWVALLPSDDPYSAMTTLMDQRAEEARRELDAGMPLLLPQMIVGAWGAFETAMSDFLISQGYTGGVQVSKRHP